MINRVVFIVPCLRSGGAEKVMVLLANAMAQKVKNVSIIFTMDDVQS